MSKKRQQQQKRNKQNRNKQTKKQTKKTNNSVPQLTEPGVPILTIKSLATNTFRELHITLSNGMCFINFLGGWMNGYDEGLIVKHKLLTVPELTLSIHKKAQNQLIKVKDKKNYVKCFS